MEELFVAPLHYGFVFFGWAALGVLGVLNIEVAALAKPTPRLDFPSRFIGTEDNLKITSLIGWRCKHRMCSAVSTRERCVR
jgi:hypothetical protein